jgi:hypothetical protein
MDDKFSALLRHVYEFLWHLAAGSGKVADHFLHHETPLLKNRSEAVSDLKN